MHMFPSVDDVFVGTVVQVAPFGSFIEHPEGPHGLLHGESLEVGTQVEVRVVNADPDTRRFSLAKA